MASGYAYPDTLFYGGGTIASGSDLSAKNGYFGRLASAVVEVGDDGTGECHGVICDGGTASGDQVALGMGHVKVIAAGAIAAGAPISCDSNGLAQTATSGDYIVGVALTLAAAANDVIEIFFTGEDITVYP